MVLIAKSFRHQYLFSIRELQSFIFMKKLLPLLFLSFLFSCKNSSNSPLFRLVSAEESGVNFNNLVEENEELNLLKYQYMYNGGGVAVGDVNGDGLADVYFSGNMVENKLYLNKGKHGNSPFTFEDITEKAGVKGRKNGKLACQWSTSTPMENSTFMFVIRDWNR
jgi:hypothetical protein